MLLQSPSKENPDYVFNLPDPPPLKSIWGYGLPLEKQHHTERDDSGMWRWKPTYTLTDQEFDDLPLEEQKEIVDVEKDRCINGYWFFNNGEPTYITGDNYFFLNFWKIDGVTPIFVKEQMYNFYFYDFVERDPNCFGSLELKPRREGCTQRKLSITVNKARWQKRKWFGILSKTAKDARDVNFGGLVNGFIDLPYWMKPEVAGDFPPKTVLEFAKPAQRTSEKNQRKNLSAHEGSLRTKIDWHTNTDKAYDGYKLHGLLLDEVAKWSNCNAFTSWITHKKCLEVGYKIIGKAYLLSTIEGAEDKDSTVESVANFINLWKNSSYKERNSMGRTMTGLYRWFIAGWCSKLEDNQGKSLVDKYGNLDSVKAQMLIDTEIASARTKAEKQLIRRQNPRNPQEALQTMAATATFDNERLLARLRELNDFEPTDERPVKYLLGNLYWHNNEKFTKVEWRADEHKPDNERRFRISYLPSVAGHDVTNNIKMLDNGTFAPFGTSQYVIGVDPFDYDAVQDGEGSFGAFLVFLKTNFANPVLSNIYCLEYMERQPSALMFYDDIYKAMFFYGAKLQIERKNYGLFRDMKNKRLTSFIMNRPEVVKWSKYTQKDNDLGTPTGTEVIKIGCELIENRLALPEPEKNENIVDPLKNFWFERSLEQLTRFDKDNSTKFDLVMAMIHTEIGSQSLKKYTPDIQTIKSVNGKTALDYLFPRFIGGQAVSHNDFRKHEGLRRLLIR